MNSQELLCYLEANKKTGFGHATRLKSFLGFFKLNFKISILTTDKLYIKKIFNHKEFNILEVKNVKKYFNGHLHKYTHLILDPPYYSDSTKINEGDYWNFLDSKNYNKIKILRFTDETFPTAHRVDYLVNPVPGIEKYYKFYSKYAKNIYLGTKYFLPLIKKSNKKSKSFDLLVAFGGNDPKNLVLKYFEFLKKLEVKKIIFCNKFTFQKLKKFANAKNYIVKYQKENNFFYILKSSKYFFSTASNIMLEALNYDKKGLVVSTQKRQDYLGKLCQKNFSNIKYLGVYNKVNEFRFKKAFKIIKQIKNNKNFKKTKKKLLKKIANDFIKKIQN
jgi:spore coat polysaccharide biosynthesis predicted glycosyltransferase SpsG